MSWGDRKRNLRRRLWISINFMNRHLREGKCAISRTSLDHNSTISSNPMLSGLRVSKLWLKLCSMSTTCLLIHYSHRVNGFIWSDFSVILLFVGRMKHGFCAGTALEHKPHPNCLNSTQNAIYKSDREDQTSKIWTALTRRRDNTSAMHQHNLHAFQTAHHHQCYWYPAFYHIYWIKS